jgi:hypothetical protein
MSIKYSKRPVKYYICSEQMYYSGHKNHEPEVNVSVIQENKENEFHYVHTRCWAKVKNMVFDY